MRSIGCFRAIDSVVGSFRIVLGHPIPFSDAAKAAETQKGPAVPGPFVCQIVTLYSVVFEKGSFGFAASKLKT